MQSVIIREIILSDNKEISLLIRKILVDLGAPKVGTAYADKTLENMYQAYQKSTSAYFIVEENNSIIGCAGIAPLDNYEGNVCELQKMYFLEEARGRGIGAKMIKICLDKARTYGFEKCYLETMPYMKAAQKLYKKNGFEYIDAPMGDTSHYSCTVWMLKDL